MDPRDALRYLGGVGTLADVVTLSSEWQVREAVKAEEIVHLAHGRYALPTAKPARQAATRLTGVVSHLSAAQIHGWEVLTVADQPWVTVPRTRRPSEDQRLSAHLRYGSTTIAVTDGVTDPVRTVLDCARQLPFREALAVADSALRHGVDPGLLRAGAAGLQGPGSTSARLVIAHADPRAGNPIESALRAIALGVTGLAVEPQLEIDLGRFKVHPDLVDPGLGLVIEAEGWLAHGSTPERFARDLERYTLLALSRRLVLRFGRDHIVDHPEWVHSALVEAVAMRAGTRFEPAKGPSRLGSSAP